MLALGILLCQAQLQLPAPPENTKPAFFTKEWQLKSDVRPPPPAALPVLAFSHRSTSKNRGVQAEVTENRGAS